MKDKQLKILPFFDSNLLIYLYSIDEPAKKKIAQKLFNSYDEILISTQVLNELANVLLKKKKLSPNKVQKAITEIPAYFIIKAIDLETIDFAISIFKKYKYSFYDSLILASAIKNECDILYSEDMHHGQTIEKTLKIISPFKK